MSHARRSSRTLLDEVGRLQQPVLTAEVTSWKQELKTAHPAAERRAWLHLWLGEWELAQNEQPRQADWHFRQAQHLTNPRTRCFGLAAYDRAIAQFYEGAYGEAADDFLVLLQPKKGFPGYDRRTCALWLRHAQVCAGSHAEHAKLGIPEPPRLDPLCGAASLAACLRPLALPYDRASLLDVCRVTGEGSNLQDLLNAGRKLGLNARPVTADDQGLRELPKPLVAYVEQDHFVAVVRADNQGVSYLCSDCGPWPGGRVDLTWAQWHALSPGIYLAVTRQGSAPDARVRAALAGSPRGAATRAPLRLSYGGPLAALRLRVHLPGGALPVLQGHVLRYLGVLGLGCGTKHDSLHCPDWVQGPMYSPGGSGAGPQQCDPVNLATGEEEYSPAPDLVVYNPSGPTISWSRVYNSLRAPDTAGLTYNSADFGVGWSHSYSYRVYNSTPGSSSPTLSLIMPNGSSVAVTGTPPASVSGTVTVQACSVPPGTPFHVDWIRFGPYQGQDQFVVTLTDRSKWVFSPAQLNSNGAYSSSVYLMTQMGDRNGHSITLQYQYGTLGLLTSIYSTSNAPGATLTINRNPDGTIGSVVGSGKVVWYHGGSYANANIPTQYPAGQSYYELDNVSRVANYTSGSQANPFTYAVSNPSPPAGTFIASATRWTYGYTPVSNGFQSEAFVALSAITVPSPASTGGTLSPSTAYINYGINFVTSLVDANRNTTSFTPSPDGTHTTVAVTDRNNSPVYSYTVGFDANMSMVTKTDGTNSTVVLTKTYRSTLDPYRATSVTNGNGNTWQFVWDQYGNLHQTVSPRKNASGSNLVTNYIWAFAPGNVPGVVNSVAQANAPLMGELQSVKQGDKAATTYLYYDAGYSTGDPRTQNSSNSGLIRTVTTAQPGVAGATNPASSTFTYTTNGNLKTATEPGNNTATSISTTYEYDNDSGDPSHNIPSFSLSQYNEFDNYGQPLTVTDNLGHATHFRYEYLTGHLSTAYDPLGNETDYTYNEAGQTLRAMNPRTGQTGTGQSYTAFNYLYPGGPLVSRQMYDENNNLVRQVNSAYGPEGELLAASGSTEPMTSGYDALYRPVSLTDGNGHATNYYYNPAGYLDSMTYPGYTGPAFPNVAGPDSMRFTYDPAGNVASRTDGNGVVTTYNHSTDPESLLTSIHYPGGQLADVSYAYDFYGRLTTMADGTGSTGYSYDDLDDPLTVLTTYAGLPTQTVSYSYFNDGSRSQMVVPYRAYSYSYDAAGRLTGLSNNVGESAAWAYQPNNWPLRQTDSNGGNGLNLIASRTYNVLGQLTDLQNSVNGSLISEFGQGSGIRHDGAGNVTSVAAGVPNTPFSGVTNYAYDSRDQLTQENSTRSGGYTIASAYDLAGNPTALRGVPGLYNADNQDTLPAANNPAFLSDGNGNPGAARGRALTFDPENRLAAAAGQAGAVPTAIAVGPDNLLRLLADNNDGSSTLANVRLYDGSIVQPVHPPYGPFPNWTAVTTAVGPNNVPHFLWNRIDGAISVWTVDAAGNYSASPQYGPFPGWTAVGMAAGPDNAVYVLWNHAPDNSLVYYRIDPTGSYTQFPTPTTAWSLPAGWSATGITVDTTDHVHLLLSNVNGQFAHWTDTAPYGPPGYLLYTPPAGFLAKGIAAGVTSSDGRIRILLARGDGAAQTWVITSDTNIGVSPVFGPYAGYTPVNLVMDWYNVGRLLFGDSQGDNFILNILPDNASTSILTSMTASHAAGTGEANAYRGDGLRAWKQNDTGARTYYLYDGSLPVCELDGSANVVAQTMFGAQGLVSRNTQTNGLSSASTLWYAFDERGNVSQRTGGNGGVASSDLYDAFGNVTSTGGPDVFGFGGQAGYDTDAETGLILCTNRFYDPQQGRFLTRDPMGYGGGINLYSYTQNNPVNWMDPDGLHLVPAPGNTPQDNQAINEALDYLKQFPPANKVINGLINSGTTYTIQELAAEQNIAGASFDNRYNTVYWDPTASFFLDTKGSLSPALMLGHELDHAYHYDQNRGLAGRLFHQPTGTDMDNEEEARTIVYFENPSARFFHNGIRHDHRFKFPGGDPRNISHVKNPTTCAR